MRKDVVSVGMVTVAMALVFLPSLATAQASLQVPLEFDFLNPGARSLALGSAFAGLADDASAAFTNPAGLTILARPEISIEGRGRRTESRFLERGRLSGTLTNRGIDVVSGPQYGTGVDTQFRPGFLSFVYPRGNRFAVAVYRHELTTLSEEFSTQGVFQLDRGIGAEVRETALQAQRSLDIMTFGGSVAFRPIQTLSIGVGGAIVDFSLDSTFTRYVTIPMDQSATYEPTRAIFEATQTGDDQGFAANIGALWMPTRMFQAGAVFRKGASANFQQSLRDLPTGPPTVNEGTFQVPDVFALGAAVRPTSATTLTVEYSRVQYGDLKDDYIDVQARPSRRETRFTIQSANEIHAGFEYVWTALSRTPALRVGYWRDPAHTVVYNAPSAPDTTDERFAAYLPGAKDLHHFTFGGGVSASTRLEINGAADLSSRRNFYSVFAVIRL